MSKRFDAVIYVIEGKMQSEIIPQPLWFVLYQGKPFRHRRSQAYTDGTIKYLRTSFGERGRAVNLAIKLNKMFNTDEFSVKRLS